MDQRNVIACDKRDAFAHGSEATEQSIVELAMSSHGLLRALAMTGDGERLLARRHCEERTRRSNPLCLFQRWIARFARTDNQRSGSLRGACDLSSYLRSPSAC